MLTFDRLWQDKRDRVAVQIDTLIVAGWAGRDAHAIEHHIEELAAIGVPRPRPCRCSTASAPAS